MLDWFRFSSEELSLAELSYEAQRALDHDAPDTAARYLLRALAETHEIERDYAQLVRLLAAVYARLELPREALTLAWYTGGRREQQVWLDRVPVLDRALSRAAWAHGSPDAAKLYGQAAAELASADVVVRAAVYYERAGSSGDALALWAKLAARSGEQDGAEYEAGLAWFNVARNSSGRELRRAAEAAVRSLEIAADRFEALGQRERAFDCYHVLMAVGQHAEEFEHVLEGSVNALRILTEDHLHDHVSRLYAHVIGLAEGAGELSAAASLARDMGEHARRHGLPEVARAALPLEAGLWERVAAQAVREQSTSPLAENALLASALAFAAAGCERQVSHVFRSLATVCPDPSRRAHFASAAARYAEHPLRLEPSPRLAAYAAPGPLWLDDLLEWEAQGRASERCADVLLDRGYQEDPITRRGALVTRLLALSVERVPERDRGDGERLLAEALARVGSYGMLSVLERLYRSPHAEVRRAAVRSLARYPYKRSFATLEPAVEDPAKAVAREAVAAIEHQRFDHAFDPLVRLFRSSGNPAARLAALGCLAELEVPEAAQIVLESLEHGSDDERAVVTRALRQGVSRELRRATRVAWTEGSPQLKALLEQALPQLSV